MNEKRTNPEDSTISEELKQQILKACNEKFYFHKDGRLSLRGIPLEFCHFCQENNRTEDEYGWYCEKCEEYWNLLATKPLKL